MKSALLAVTSLALPALAKLDPNLHRSFWGMAYSSDGVILPDCGATQEQVSEDILLIAQLTPRLRSYGSDCNQTSLIMQAINDTNVDLLYYPTIYISAPFNQTVVNRQLDAIKTAFTTYGVSYIGGLTVGNEFLLNSYGDSGTASDANGVAARKQLLSAIATINTTVQSWDLGKPIPVGTSDAASSMTTPLCEGIDYFFGNDHPWFGNVSVNNAASWAWEFMQQNPIAICDKAKTQPEIVIGEIGWPTASDEKSYTQRSGGSLPSVADLQTFMDDYVCTANTNGSEYFFFSFQDSTWAGNLYGGVEGHWGLFDANRNLKSGLTLPTCTVDSPLGGTVDQSILSNTDSTSAAAALSATISSTGKPKSSSGSNGTHSSGAWVSASTSMLAVVVVSALLLLCA